MRRESHRRRGFSRASSGGWGHRAVYLGAIVASAALVAGFGSALLVYGPLGAQQHQVVGSNLNVPPKGVSFGNASAVFASQLNTTNATGGAWNWSNPANGSYSGPCAQPGVLNLNNGTYGGGLNNSSAVNLSANVTIVCLNAVNDSALNATWYAGTFGVNYSNNYTIGGVPNGSWVNTSYGNFSSCSNFTLYHELANASFGWANGSYIPCQTYFQMNNNTEWLPTYANYTTFPNGTPAHYGNSTILWEYNQTGYLPGDVVYQVPVDFANVSNGTFAVSVAIQGVTPFAQTFFFSHNTTTSAGGGANSTVIFVFDMTAAWMMDLGGNNTTDVYNTTTLAIYGSVNVVSAIVSQCSTGAMGQAVCPIAAPQE